MENTNKKENEKTQNLSIYEAVRRVPENATKPIKEGRLKGKTDINPMWRIQVLTELFGPCSIGWKVEVTRQWTEQGDDNTIAAFVNVNLYIRDPKTGQWGEPIPGNGGNVFKRRENSGNIFIDDDCYKKATSDAIGSAAKMLGVGADIYWETEATKNSPASSTKTAAEPTVKNRPESKPELTPQHASWNKSVTKAMATSDDTKRIRERIEEIFTITDENYRRLLKEAGKLND